jgi:hypothetical protein
MKRIIILHILSLFFISISFSQNFFTIYSGQPQSLLVNAGTDVSIITNQSVQIGGNPSAEFGYGHYNYSWLPIDGLDNPSIPNPVATPDGNITYVLTVTDSLGCIASDTIHITIITYAESLVKESNIQLYPNPNDGSFVLDFKKCQSEKTEILVFNISGEAEYSETIIPSELSNHQLQLTLLPPGYYYLRISNDSFNIVKSFVIIK